MAIEIEIKSKSYGKRIEPLPALNGFALTVGEGEKVAIVGESGVGKTTLLNILGLIDRKFEGEYRLLGQDVDKLSEQELASWRNSSIGFVLQESALINTLSISDNITLPILYSRPRIDDWRQRFEEIVSLLGIGHIVNKKPLECSGGEKARAVFARAIIMRPSVILADEPTGSLDEENRERMLRLLFGLNEDYGVTIVTVTHDSYVAGKHDRVVQLKSKD
ncbi:ABC transporter ATP-binding protein [Cutibacterium sp.]|uniref:ABC transporter ATP-binding protein n=1 Tax=Cutibacterium sp. TaxID=1912221 RepID=UPI0026DAA645|nr:ABC transporter ATP-binding protein [Cutibacterium sp.]MDO4412742.1 ABC transporter ATP-binding protein [Cutibacterium sp.]